MKHTTPLPCPSHLPRATTVHHQKHLVHAATLRISMMTTRTLPTLSTNTVMIQPPFFIFHPLPKSLPLCHPHQLPSQHMHSKHQFDTSPLPASPCHPHHRLWRYAQPVHPALPSLTSCPSQTSLVLWMLTCTQPPVPPKPSTFGKPSTMPRKHKINLHHCPWMLSPLASHVVAKHATPLPHPSHLPHAATVHHQKHLVHAATLRIPMTTTRTLPTCSTNTITGKHTINTSCRHLRIEPL